MALHQSKLTDTASTFTSTDLTSTDADEATTPTVSFTPTDSPFKITSSPLNIEYAFSPLISMQLQLLADHLYGQQIHQMQHLHIPHRLQYFHEQ